MGFLLRIFGRTRNKVAIAATVHPVVAAEAPPAVDREQDKPKQALSGSVAPSAAVPIFPTDSEPEPETAPRVKRVVLPKRDLSVLDLRGVKSTRTRIVGSAYCVTDAGRKTYGDTEYLLLREPENEWDVHAIAVYGKGRKVGYLSEAKAAALAPIFDTLDFDAFRVSGTSVSPNSMRLWVDLPSLPALRAFLKKTVALSQF